MNGRCTVCNNYMTELDRCKFCHFEWVDDYPPCSDDPFDILDMQEEDGWEHIQIKDRLYYKGIKCWSADIWFDNNMAIIVNPQPSNRKGIADALGIHEEVVYDDCENGLMILNLFQEKWLRDELDE